VKIKYTDFNGTEREVEAEVTIETVSGPINESLVWEEVKLFVRVEGKIVARKGLDYREVPK